MPTPITTENMLNNNRLKDSFTYKTVLHPLFCRRNLAGLLSSQENYTRISYPWNVSIFAIIFARVEVSSCPGVVCQCVVNPISPLDKFCIATETQSLPKRAILNLMRARWRRFSCSLHRLNRLWVPFCLLYCLICAFFRASFGLHLFALTTENRLFSLGFEMCLVYRLGTSLVIDQSISTLVFAIQVRIVWNNDLTRNQ